MEQKFFDMHARIESFDRATAIFCDPVYSTRSQKYDSLVILWALDHSTHRPDLLILRNYTVGILCEQIVQVLPG